MRRLTQEQFIEKAKAVHGDVFVYDKSKYINNRVMMTITCKIHGDFEQIPNSHLLGFGCEKCGGTYQLTTKEFIHKAKKVHGDKYNYDKVQYVNYTTKIIITCKEHGDFEQRPADHLSNKGCSKCNMSKGELLVEKILTDNNIEFIPQKTFLNCKTTRLMPFDFYIPVINTCIEYDGELHFKSVEHFGGDARLTNIQRKDAIKTKFCEDNGINLIRIPYTHSEEKIYKSIESLVQLL